MKKWMIVLTMLFVGVLVLACQTTTTTTTATTATTGTTTSSGTTTTSQSTTTTTTTTTTTLPTSLSVLEDLDPTPENVIGAYKLSTSEGTATIQYDKRGLEWTSMEIPVSEDVSRFNKLVVGAKGDGILLVRFVGETETWEVRLSLTSNSINYQIDLRDWDDFLGTLEKIVLIAAPGETDARGEIVLSQVTFDVGTAYGTVVDLEKPGLDITYGWAENDAGTYAITNELDDTVTIAYTKVVGQEWAFAKNIVDATDSAGYNTLTVVASGTETKQILVKLNNRYETWITFDGTEQTTVISVPETLEQVMIFAEGGVAPVTGTFSLKSMTLSYVTPAGSISELDTYDFATGWTDAGDSVYTFVEADGATTVNYVKGAGQSWSSMVQAITEDLSALNTVTLVLQGTAGKQILFKYNNSVEQWITLDGTEQTVVIPLSVAKLTEVRIFAEGGTESVSGSFQIKSAYASYVASGTDLNTGWAENDADTYDITTAANGLVTVAYTKAAGQEWVYMSTTFDADAVAGMNVLLVVLRGTPGKQVLVKLNNSIETWVTFRNTDPVYVYVDADALTNLLLFAEGGTASVSGTFEILKVEALYEEPEALERSAVYDFATGWIDNDGGVYTITEDAGVTTVSWTGRTANWAFLKNIFDENLANHNMITITVQGTAGQQLIIKPNDNNAYEQTITFDGTAQTFTFLVANPNKVLIFVDPILAGTDGSFQILSAEVTYVPQPLSVTGGWAENDADTYVIDQDNEDGSVIVNYTTRDTYQFMIVNIDANEAYGLNTLTIVVQGTAGKSILVKPNDSGALETAVVFDGTQQTLEFTAAAFSKILIFAAPGTAGGETGTFTIVSVTLTYAPAE